MKNKSTNFVTTEPSPIKLRTSIKAGPNTTSGGGKRDRSCNFDGRGPGTGTRHGGGCYSK